MQVSNDTESVIDTDTAGRGIVGIDYRVLGIAHHYWAHSAMQKNAIEFFDYTIETEVQ